MPTPLSLLLVEDNDDDAALILRELRVGGYTVELVRVDSLAVFEAALPTMAWDLVISDYHLKSFEAPEVLLRLRSSGNDVPCIIVSGTIDEATAVACMRSGASDFVSKQNLKRLVPAIERELRERAARAKAVADLRETEASFQAVIERLQDAVIVHRGDDVVYANHAAARLFGYESPAAMLGLPVSSVAPDEEEWRRLAERLRQILTTGTPSPWREQRMRRHDGSIVDVEVSGTRVHIAGGPAILVLFRDISERRALTAKMMQIDRMISAGTLAAGVGHEINNPLAYVMTNLEWLADHLRALRASGRIGSDDDEAFSVIDDCQNGARRIRDIVRGLQTFARADEPSGAPVDLRPIIESAIGMAANVLKQRAKVQYEHAGEALVDARGSRLGQVFLNLIVNAAQAIREGARFENEITIRAWTDAQHVVVSVADTGAGISPDVMPRIFDPFFTTKPVGEGTGLGLAICRDLVNGLGGEITAESELGAGSTFVVRIPRASVAAATAATAAPPRSYREAPVRRRRVLVVDDEPKLGAIFKRVLGDEHDVVFVSDGRDALELINRDEHFDIMFLDLMMPDVSGMDLYAHIEATRPSWLPRVVVMTGGAYTQSARDLVERLATPPMTKPLDFDDVRERITCSSSARS